MIDQLFEKFDGAFAQNTLRAYRADFNHFSDWCKKNKVKLKKTTGEDWKHYIEHCASHLSTATVRRRINSLGTVHRLAGLQEHTRHPEVILALKRMHRQKGRAQKQAVPLTKDILKQLLAVCEDDLRGQRNRVLLTLGYETMRRRSELCAFRFENIQTLPNGKKAILMERSKTDQYGNGKLIPITEDLYQLLSDWGEYSGGKGPIIRGINRHGVLKTNAMCPANVSLILKKLQTKAKLECEELLSGHSFRVGRALDLLIEGEPLEKIMLRGGWQMESTAMKYLRAWQEI